VNIPASPYHQALLAAAAIGGLAVGYIGVRETFVEGIDDDARVDLAKLGGGVIGTYAAARYLGLTMDDMSLEKQLEAGAMPAEPLLANLVLASGAGYVASWLAAAATRAVLK
jgi:hypothetical protein